MSYAAFIQKWTHTVHAPNPVTAADLEAAERRVGVALPKSYKAALIQNGAVSANIDLLDAIVERGLDVADVQAFLTDDDIVTATEAWRQLGLPRDCIAFARDSAGNLFCFRRGGAAVWYWDHDFRDIENVAPDFETWIGAYCAIEPA